MDQVGDTSRTAGDRTACINIRELPLQLLLRKHPEWRERPVAVLKKENTQCPILWINSAASQSGIQSGMRYSSALSLDQNLCAGTISEGEIQAVLRQILKLLDRFSPRVEPCEQEPGIFWMDASGLDKLYESPEEWTRQIDSHLTRLQFQANITVGFSRFGSYALAKGKNQVTVIPSREVEETECRRVRLLHLHLEPALRDRLEKLAVFSVGDFLDLPKNSIAYHLGEHAWSFYQFASEAFPLPIQSRRIQEPLSAWMDLNESDCNSMRLLFWIKQLLDPMLKAIAERCQAVGALHLQILLQDGVRHRQRIQATRATLEGSILLDLVRLRLETVSFHVPPVELFLELEGARVSAEELNLLQRNPRRNREAALHALARIRAEFGPDSVFSVRLESGHLPEACFEWQPFKRFCEANPRSVAIRSLIRRVHARPELLGKSPENFKQSSGLGGLLRNPPPLEGGVRGGGRVYRINGGWWNREVRRNYRFVNTEQGETLWIFYDEQRRCWYSQGRVE